MSEENGKRKKKYSAFNEAMMVLGEQYKNVFILVETVDGGLEWHGSSDYFGAGACNEFIKIINQDEEIEIDLDED